MTGTPSFAWRLYTTTRHIKITLRRKCYSTSNVPCYSYKPLRANEIRLIDLHPGRDAEPLRCAIRSVTLAERASYESLSYCWGVNKPEEEIQCDDGAIPVTKNLSTALQHLRHEQHMRTLWIDAISINQADIEERGQQVGLMKDVFQLSERTVVWLGEDSTGSDCAVRLIRQLAEAAPKRPSQHLRWSNQCKEFPPLYDLAWREFTDILHRPWFRRAWIVQEVSVTRDVLIVCGKETFTWNQLVRAIQYGVHLGNFIAYGGSMTYQALRLFETRSNFQTGDLPSLHKILINNRSCLATDARDKVFGLLSLANPEDVLAMGVRPDYHLSVNQLYKRIAFSLLKRPDLSVFSASCVHNNSLESSLPSWVSDWSASDPSVPLNSMDSLDYGDTSSYTSLPAPDFNASKSTTSSPVFDQGETLLGLEGLLIDRVESVGALSRTRYLRHVSHMFELFVQCRDILEQLKDWETVAKARSRNPYITGEKSHDAYWNTLCAGRVPNGLVSARKDPRFKYYIIIRSLRSFVRITIRWFPRTEKDTWYNRLFFSMYQAAWRVFGLTPAKIQRIGFPPESRLSNHRRMVRTEKGYIALAPRFTKEGDYIGVFKGGKMPLVVRKEGGYWVLIGESYVHGIMGGEAWDEESCKLMWFK